MRRPLLESYTLVGVAGGSVVCFQRGNRKEYLGTDGLWQRSPNNCDAFSSDTDAQTAIDWLREDDASWRN